MNDLAFDQLLDARGLSCPMPLVKARQGFDRLEPGQVLKVLATDRGSLKDFQGWARVARNVELLAQESAAEAGGEVFVHYLRRTR